MKNRRWKKEAIIKIGRRFSYHRRNHRWEREPWRPVCVLGMRATSERERVNQRWSVRFFARPVHWHSATLSLSKINIEASPLPAHRQKNFERCSIRLLIDSRHPRNFRSNTRTRACSVERPLKNRLSGGNWVDGKGRFRMHAFYYSYTPFFLDTLIVCVFPLYIRFDKKKKRYASNRDSAKQITWKLSAVFSRYI